jgi:Kef-type K+ transport system membrane component KefB
VGITARVLKDLGKLSLRESRIILGAAVIDDVIGLMILAVVIGAVSATIAGGSLSFVHIFGIAAKTAIFFVGAFALGHYVVPHIFRGAGKLRSRGVLLVLSIAFCFGLSWLATRVELATIVGAFAAGLVLDEVHFKLFKQRGEHDLGELLDPVTTFLVPIFFVLMGMKVDLRVFARPQLLGFALALTLAAIIGKQICSLAVAEGGLNRLAIGLGMIPRGEVGLIVAGIGASLMLPNSAGALEPVIGTATFGAVVIMVIVTTLVTPPLLKWSLARGKQKADGRRQTAEGRKQ